MGKYKEIYGADPANEYDAAARYDSVFIVANALTSCGEKTDCIRDFLYNMDWYEGKIGKYRFDGKGDIEGITYATKIAQNGTFVIYEDK